MTDRLPHAPFPQEFNFPGISSLQSAVNASVQKRSASRKLVFNPLFLAGGCKVGWISRMDAGSNSFFECAVAIPLARIILYAYTTSVRVCVSVKPIRASASLFNLKEDNGMEDLQLRWNSSSLCLPPAASTRRGAVWFGISHPCSERKFSFTKTYNYYMWHS